MKKLDARVKTLPPNLQQEVQVSSDELLLTDFSLHSIGIVLPKLKQMDAWVSFVQDTLMEGSVNLIHLEPKEMRYLSNVMRELKLDFDDVYQYAASEKYDLRLVSFDGDFDRTKRGRKTPLNRKLFDQQQTIFSAILSFGARNGIVNQSSSLCLYFSILQQNL